MFKINNVVRITNPKYYAIYTNSEVNKNTLFTIINVIHKENNTYTYYIKSLSMGITILNIEEVDLKYVNEAIEIKSKNDKKGISSDEKKVIIK